MPKVLALNNKTCHYEPIRWVDMRYKKPRISNRKHSYKKSQPELAYATLLIKALGVLMLIAAVCALTK